MRLAYICTDKNLAVLGTSGRAAFIQELLRTISGKGAQIDLFAAQLDGDRPEGLRSLVIHKLSLFGADLASEDTTMLRANRELRGLLDGARGGGFSFVLERFSPWSFAGTEYAKAHGIPCLLEVTSSGLEEFANLGEGHRKIAKEVLQSATVALAASTSVAEDLGSLGIHSVKMPGPIDPEKYSTGARLTIRKTGAFTIGYLGNLDCWEPLQPLVDAFAGLHRKHPESRLVVAGDGSAKTCMITELSRTGLLGTACFLGKLPARRIAGMLSAVDITVAFGKGDGEVIRDSMLAGVPVIHCGDSAGVVRDRVNGLLCPGDAKSLQLAMETLCNDRIQRLRLGSNSRRSLVTDQTWIRLANELLECAKPPKSSLSPPDFIPTSHVTL